MTAELPPRRGHVYTALLGEQLGERMIVVVSNDQRNRHLGDVLAVPVSSASRPPLDTVIECGPADPVSGRVLCDDLLIVGRDEISTELGALSPSTLHDVDSALRAALAL